MTFASLLEFKRFLRWVRSIPKPGDDAPLVERELRALYTLWQQEPLLRGER